MGPMWVDVGPMFVRCGLDVGTTYYLCGLDVGMGDMCVHDLVYMRPRCGHVGYMWA